MYECPQRIAADVTDVTANQRDGRRADENDSSHREDEDENNEAKDDATVCAIKSEWKCLYGENTM